MKGKDHVLSGVLILFIFLIIIAYFDQDFTFFTSKIQKTIYLPTIMLSIYLYIGGLLLPDSDSEDMGSTIYYSIFFPIAILLKLLEYPIARLLKREIGHRESLHTIIGIIITSLTIIFLVWIIALAFGLKHNFYFLLILFISLFSGQMIHLIQDMHFELV